MTDPYDRDSWEERWSRALREHGDRVALRAPNAHLTAELAELPPGRALDAGCGHGAETLWLATRGWRVTAVDFAATALAYARSAAAALGPDVAQRIDWIGADLAAWAPPRHEYDLVVSLYVHVAGPVEEMVRRIAAGLARGGTLFLVGHRPVDPATGAATPPPARCRCRSRRRSPPSIPAGGRRSSRRSARGRRAGPASTR